MGKAKNTEKITIRLSEEEKETLNMLASKHGKKASTLGREILIAHMTEDAAEGAQHLQETRSTQLGNNLITKLQEIISKPGAEKWFNVKFKKRNSTEGNTKLTLLRVSVFDGDHHIR